MAFIQWMGQKAVFRICNHYLKLVWSSWRPIWWLEVKYVSSVQVFMHQGWHRLFKFTAGALGRKNTCFLLLTAHGCLHRVERPRSAAWWRTTFKQDLNKICGSDVLTAELFSCSLPLGPQMRFIAAAQSRVSPRLCFLRLLWTTRGVEADMWEASHSS